MNFSDVLIPASGISAEQWQLGYRISKELHPGGVALIFASDFRGAGLGGGLCNFSTIRENLYRLSCADFEIPISDLGDLRTGQSSEDTHYILQEVLLTCIRQKALPVIVGGSEDLSYPLCKAVCSIREETSYTHISSKVSLKAEDGMLSSGNFFHRILGGKEFSLKNVHLLGLQSYLNDWESVALLADIGVDAVRLSEMAGSPERCEPYFRRADLVTISCDAVESFCGEFSIHPQVNGLGRREVCAYMKEAGLSENLKAAGVFNFNFFSENTLNHQLLAQMIWHLIEGINIRRTHPQEKNFETYYVLVGDNEYAFHKEVFSGLWYFGNSMDEGQWLPCSRMDFEDAKRGFIKPKFLEK